VEGPGQALAADLVVDAGGRGSRLPAWLEDLGYGRPAEETVKVEMGYATRVYRREPWHLDGALMVNVAAQPGLLRACGMLAQEGDRWIVTLAGYGSHQPPTDEAGWLEFAASLPTPEVHETLRHATPLSDIVAYKFPSNLRRRYDRMARFPKGLLVLGDALCSYTPIYGQGMSVAAGEAEMLGKVLAAGPESLARRFFAAVQPLVDMAWSISAEGDQQLTLPQSALPRAARAKAWYVNHLQRATHRDAVVARAFLMAASFMAPPSVLTQPRMLLRVLRTNLLPPRDAAAGLPHSSPVPSPVAARAE
jgi:2-polyprenyl-6-methoxyphenol hydroxylase-like FAD-dependent oxidoreductase